MQNVAGCNAVDLVIACCGFRGGMQCCESCERKSLI